MSMTSKRKTVANEPSVKKSRKVMSLTQKVEVLDKLGHLRVCFIYSGTGDVKVGAFVAGRMGWRYANSNLGLNLGRATRCHAGVPLAG